MFVFLADGFELEAIAPIDILRHCRCSGWPLSHWQTVQNDRGAWIRVVAGGTRPISPDNAFLVLRWWWRQESGSGLFGWTVCFVGFEEIKSGCHLRRSIWANCTWGAAWYRGYHLRKEYLDENFGNQTIIQIGRILSQQRSEFAIQFTLKAKLKSSNWHMKC